MSERLLSNIVQVLQKEVPLQSQPSAYLILKETILEVPDIARAFHLLHHYHTARLHVLHSSLDGEVVAALFVLHPEVPPFLWK